MSSLTLTERLNTTIWGDPLRTPSVSRTVRDKNRVEARRVCRGAVADERLTRADFTHAASWSVCSYEGRRESLNLLRWYTRAARFRPSFGVHPVTLEKNYTATGLSNCCHRPG